MEIEQIAGVIVLLVVIYFFSMMGIKLANQEFNDLGIAWTGAIILFIMGWGIINDNRNPLGFVGFIPVVTYIVFKIFNSVGFDYSTKKKFKAIILSGVASSATYAVTHSLFGFGIPEASISAVIAAGILGSIGYTA